MFHQLNCCQNASDVLCVLSVQTILNITAKHTCDPDFYQCDDKRCIPDSKLCDGSPDCFDESDEADCPSLNCTNGKWTCKSKSQCIPDRYHCDGAADCQDGSDEVDCRKLHYSVFCIFQASY